MPDVSVLLDSMPSEFKESGGTRVLAIATPNVSSSMAVVVDGSVGMLIGGVLCDIRMEGVETG
ncbi:MAG: hypothetical protein JXX29_07650 [Deltaproteobacteria bacterium]|nr:hypothetical protein [Deltaproteobacteria bacterium]